MANMIILSDTTCKRKEDGKVFEFSSEKKLRQQHKIVGDERKPKTVKKPAAPKPVVHIDVDGDGIVDHTLDLDI